VRYWPIHLRGLFNAPLGSGAQFLLVAGPTVNYYANSSNAVVKTIHGTDFGIGGLVGFRIKVFNWLAIRADGTVDYMPSPANAKDEIIALGTTEPAPSSNTHLGVQLGLSLMTNSKCTKRLDAIDLTPNTANATTGQTCSSAPPDGCATARRPRAGDLCRDAGRHGELHRRVQLQSAGHLSGRRAHLER